MIVNEALSDEEKQSVSRLLRYGNPVIVIQIYFACQKDETSARNILEGFE